MAQGASARKRKDGWHWPTGWLANQRGKLYRAITRQCIYGAGRPWHSDKGALTNYLWLPRHNVWNRWLNFHLEKEKKRRKRLRKTLYWGPPLTIWRNCFRALAIIWPGKKKKMRTLGYITLLNFFSNRIFATSEEVLAKDEKRISSMNSLKCYKIQVHRERVSWSMLLFKHLAYLL